MIDQYQALFAKIAEKGKISASMRMDSEYIHARIGSHFYKIALGGDCLEKAYTLLIAEVLEYEGEKND